MVEVRLTWKVLTRRGWQTRGGAAWTPPAKEDFSSAAGSAVCEKSRQLSQLHRAASSKLVLFQRLSTSNNSWGQKTICFGPIWDNSNVSSQLQSFLWVGRDCGPCFTPWHLLPGHASAPPFHRYWSWGSMGNILSTKICLREPQLQHRGGRKPAGLMKMVYNLIWELAIELCVYVNTHWIVDLRFVPVTMYKSYLKKEK